MSYKPLRTETIILAKEPSDVPKGAPQPVRLPKHSISISLVLAIISYCCCVGLGIIPLIMVVFAYVKRETGKHQEAKRLSNCSRVFSTVLIVLSIILIVVFVAHSIVMAVYGRQLQHKMSKHGHPYGNDMVYPPGDDVIYPPSDYVDYKDGDVYNLPRDDMDGAEEPENLGADNVDYEVYDILNDLTENEENGDE